MYKIIHLFIITLYKYHKIISLIKNSLLYLYLVIYTIIKISCNAKNNLIYTKPLGANNIVHIPSFKNIISQITMTYLQCNYWFTFNSPIFIIAVL